MNIPLATNTSLNNWGTVYMHAIEMRKEGRLKMVYVSNERRLRNSNVQMNGYVNHNFNLHMAEVKADGTLTDKRQLEYYTTTSALSPFRLRNGLGFAYPPTTTIRPGAPSHGSMARPRSRSTYARTTIPRSRIRMAITTAR